MPVTPQAFTNPYQQNSIYANNENKFPTGWYNYTIPGLRRAFFFQHFLCKISKAEHNNERRQNAYYYMIFFL